MTLHARSQKLSSFGRVVCAYCDFRPAMKRKEIYRKLCSHLGITRATLYRWMRGESSPSPQEIAKTAVYLKTKKEEIDG